ncbi:MAG: hypothetical protein IPN59_12840 [Holophaga sp.]|nr:hypothetical protein [Holophaga sp.]
MRGDGSDYGPLWNGQTVLQAYYLGMLLMPTAPAIVSGILKNFLNSQHDDGSINFRLGTPGLGSSPWPRRWPHPCPAQRHPDPGPHGWRLYEASPDRELLVAVLPGLHRFFESWFLPEQDRDGDGLPEWSSPLQSGLEDHPIYAHWLDGAPGLDITTVESPDLATFLYSEAQALINIAQILDRKEISKAVQKRLKILKSAVEKTYSARAGIYQTRDRETHQVSKAENLGERIGPGEIPLTAPLPRSQGLPDHPDLGWHASPARGADQRRKSLGRIFCRNPDDRQFSLAPGDRPHHQPAHLHSPACRLVPHQTQPTTRSTCPGTCSSSKVCWPMACMRLPWTCSRG